MLAMPARSLRLLIIPSWYPSRVSPEQGSFFRDQARFLIEHGVDVRVAYVSQTPLRDPLKTARLWREHSDYAKQPFDVSRPGLSIRPTALNQFVWRARLRHLALKTGRTVRPDAILAMSAYDAGAVALDLSRKLRVPYIVIEHSSRFVRDSLPPGAQQRVQQSLLNAQAVAAVSRRLGDHIARVFGLDRDVTVLHNPVSPEFRRRSALPLAAPSKGKNFRFLTIAWLSRHKNIHLTIEAIGILRSQGHHVQLSVAGDGPERATLERAVLRQGLRQEVRFLGALTPDLVQDAIAESDALVSASRYEPFGLTIAEALVGGKPVVAAPAEGPVELVDSGSGVIADDATAIAMAGAMARLILNRNEYHSESIAAHAWERFSPAVYCDAVVELVRSASSDSPY